MQPPSVAVQWSWVSSVTAQDIGHMNNSVLYHFAGFLSSLGCITWQVTGQQYFPGCPACHPGLGNRMLRVVRSMKRTVGLTWAKFSILNFEECNSRGSSARKNSYSSRSRLVNIFITHIYIFITHNSLTYSHIHFARINNADTKTRITFDNRLCDLCNVYYTDFLALMHQTSETACVSTSTVITNASM